MIISKGTVVNRNEYQTLVPNPDYTLKYQELAAGEGGGGGRRSFMSNAIPIGCGLNGTILYSGVRPGELKTIGIINQKMNSFTSFSSHDGRVYTLYGLHKYGIKILGLDQ